MELKPCPFCGESASLIKDKHEWYFICHTGHVFQFGGMDEDLLSMDVIENALEEWNRRASE